jgi:uncharacterized protein (DUF1501 family)
MDISRRSFLTGAATLAAAAALGASCAAAASLPSAGDKRFVFVFLRGGADGMTLFPPYADPDYAAARGPLAVPPPGAEGGCLRLDDRVGLHPLMAPLLPLWQSGEMLVAQAVGPWFRDRSHFAVQEVIETGYGLPGHQDGWLNRLIAAGEGSPLASLTAGPLQALSTRGSVRTDNWYPMQETLLGPGTVLKLSHMYATDPKLSPMLEAGLSCHDRVDYLLDGTLTQQGGGRRVFPTFSAMAGALGKIMAADGGPNIGFIDNASWDTHVKQANMHARLVPEFVRAVLGLKEGLGRRWRDTVVVVASEFGRRVSANSGLGCDHGTGGAAVALFGGAVGGGRVVGDWPGLAQGGLYNGCDLMPTTDLRAVFKGVLGDLFGVSERLMSDTLFPGSADVAPLRGLIRA